MKYLVISYCVLVTLFSCSQSADDPIEGFGDLNDSVSPRASVFDPLLMAEINLDFKEDFPASRTEDEAQFGTLSTEILAKFKSYDKMIEMYPKAKEAMIAHPEQPHAIQAISLGYLRKYFIPRSDEASFVETEFLLDLIVNNGGVDLDVMADAYAKISDRISQQDQSRYLAHFEKVYNHDMDGIYDEFEKQKNIYFSTKDKREKFGALYHGKRLERRSKAAIYARDLLNLNVTTQKF